MAVTFGFFDSVSNDRRYNAEQMCNMLKGVISKGVFQNVDNGLRVESGSGYTVNVLTGRAIIGDNLRWLQNDDSYPITLTSPHATLDRYTAIVIRLNESDRSVSIVAKDGEPASSPVRPPIASNELCLAYISVRRNVSAIIQTDITDTRSDSTVCGWVRSLI